MSRIENTITNIKVNFIFYIIMTLVIFISRKIYIEYLGDEIVGLNSLILNILGFFNLAEFGVSSTISYALYKPLSEKNKFEINRILSIFGYLYSRIGIYILIFALLFSFFLPYLFDKTKLNIGYIYASFIIFLFSNILGYFINFKQLIFSANQKNYISVILQNSITIIKVFFQVLSLLYLSYGYYLWLLWEAIFAIINSKILLIIINKEYPWLNVNKTMGKRLLIEYHWLLKKTKQVFSHIFASFVLTQTDTIIVYIILNLNAVTSFTNYTMITNKISGMINSLFSNSTATVGNLIVENNKIKIINVFWEWMSLRHLIAFILSFSLFQMTESFITIWIGKTYIINEWILYLLILNTFITIERSTIDTYINGYGLFSDVWAPWIEAFINLTVSLIGAYYFGLHGIVFGTFISLLIIVVCWKPYFLFKKGFNLSIKYYWIEKVKILTSGAISLVLAYFVSKHFTIIPDNYLSWSVLALLNLFTITILCIFFLYICTNGMKDLIKRFSSIITRY